MKAVMEICYNDLGGIKVYRRIDMAEKPPSQQQRNLAKLLDIAADAVSLYYDTVKPPKEPKKR